MALPAPPASSLSLFSIAHALAGGPAGAARPRARTGRLGRSPRATLFHGTPDGLRGGSLDDEAPPRAARGADRRQQSRPGLCDRAPKPPGSASCRTTGPPNCPSSRSTRPARGSRPFPGVHVELAATASLWVRSPYRARRATSTARPARCARRADWSTVGDRAESAAAIARAPAAAPTTRSSPHRRRSSRPRSRRPCARLPGVARRGRPRAAERRRRLAGRGGDRTGPRMRRRRPHAMPRDRRVGRPDADATGRAAGSPSRAAPHRHRQAGPRGARCAASRPGRWRSCLSPPPTPRDRSADRRRPAHPDRHPRARARRAHGRAAGGPGRSVRP